MTKRITVSVSEALHKRLQEHAQVEDTTLSQAAARLLAQWFEDQGAPIPAQDNTWGGDRKSSNEGEGTA